VTDASSDARLVRLEKAVLRSLELLDEGRIEEARDALLGVAPTAGLPAPEPSGAITDQEFDSAFEHAEPETDRMLDANQVAQVAIRQADRALDAEDLSPDRVGASFATATMAELLEQQGDGAGASRIRESLVESSAEPGPARPGRRDVIQTLERWLENLRGGARA
jgi:hypothetical protein